MSFSAAPGSYIRVADASLGDGRANGRIETPALDASWDLTFSDDHEPFHHLPRDFLYRAPLRRTKFLSPYPDALFDGGIELDGERIEIEGWRGMIGHNWGAEHAERWVWVQGSGFDGRSPEDYFDMAVGRIKVGGATTPWVGNAMLMLDGKAHRLGASGTSRARRSPRSRPARASSSRGRASRSPAASGRRPRTSSPGSTRTRSAQSTTR